MLNPKLLGEAFPINKVEVFFDAEDHSDFLGFQWEQISQGKIPVGIDTSDDDFNSIGQTGGEKEHTLTVDEMPSHTHSAKFKAGAQSGSTTYIIDASGSGGANVNNLTGGNKPHNNMPPYIVMAFWRRVA